MIFKITKKFEIRLIRNQKKILENFNHFEIFERIFWKILTDAKLHEIYYSTSLTTLHHALPIFEFKNETE